MGIVHTADRLESLHSQVDGAILRPGDPDYEQARRAWNLSVDQHPALILIAGSVQDIVAAVRFANANNLGVAVQLTGHGVKYPADDDLLIITSRLNAVSVDAYARTARVEAGAIWQNVLDAATPHGLAPLLGTSPHIGVVGYTLGGGIGWLARRYGLAADSVLSIDLVTPDGQLRHSSAEENADLFWALRGGGGNFGVVTGMEFKLYPVATVYGGALTYPGALARDALHFYRDWVADVPDDLTSSISVLRFSNLPQLPDNLRGQLRVILRAVHAGDAAEGERLMQPWLAWQTPMENTLRQLPFSEIATISNDPVAPAPAYPTSNMLGELTDEAIDVVARYATDRTSPLIFNELRHAGGAIMRVDPDANAIGNRDARFYLQISGLAFTPEIRTAMDHYLRQYQEALRPYLHGGIYMNFAGSNQAAARVQDAYLPHAYQRLVALKAQVDPKNLFRYSYPLVAHPSHQPTA